MNHCWKEEKASRGGGEMGKGQTEKSTWRRQTKVDKLGSYQRKVVKMYSTDDTSLTLEIWSYVQSITRAQFTLQR